MVQEIVDKIINYSEDSSAGVIIDRVGIEATVVSCLTNGYDEKYIDKLLDKYSGKLLDKYSGKSGYSGYLVKTSAVLRALSSHEHK